MYLNTYKNMVKTSKIVVNCVMHYSSTRSYSYINPLEYLTWYWNLMSNFMYKYNFSRKQLWYKRVLWEKWNKSFFFLIHSVLDWAGQAGPISLLLVRPNHENPTRLYSQTRFPRAPNPTDTRPSQSTPRLADEDTWHQSISTSPK
jgi:hypothetical protein